jgi:uncharacterized protein (DUF302 family)
MSYYFSKTLDLGFEDAVARTRAALAEEGFGVITEIDIRQTLKAKLGVEFRPYIILGACNPKMAYAAPQAEDKIGAMLPCNVVVQDAGGGRTEVVAIDPVASMQAIANPDLTAKAREVADGLKRAIDSL